MGTLVLTLALTNWGCGVVLAELTLSEGRGAMPQSRNPARKVTFLTGLQEGGEEVGGKAL